MKLRPFLPLLCSLVGLVFVACSSTPQVCKPEGAREAGIAQAMRGEDYNESVGGVCEEENRNIFKTNFSSGYQEGKSRYCTPTSVENTGQAHGQEGRRAEFSEANFRICESKAGLKGAYFNGYKRGLDQFCDDHKANEMGHSVGESGRAPEFPEGKYAVCGNKIGKLRSAYSTGHKTGLAKYCTPTNAENQGREDGAHGADVVDIAGKYQICGSAKAQQIAKVYVSAYGQGFAQFCSGDNITKKAREQAEKNSAGTFPPEYSKCLSKYPELNVQFTAVFREARRHVVESQCTYQNGLAHGQQEAERTNDKKTTMPEFCDSQLFGVYLSGYLEGWKQTKDRICNATEAYKAGVQTGLNGQQLAYNPPGNCPGEYQQALSAKYNEGYYYGASQRNTQYPGGGGAVQVGGGQVNCRSNAECRPGQYCRNRGDGVNLCMGGSGRGYYCISSSDCAPGLYCKSLPQNPQFRVCN